MKFSFWKYWHSDEKLPLFSGIFLTVIAALFCGYYWYSGSNEFYPVSTTLQAETVQVVPAEVERMFYRLPVEVPAFVAFEKYVASEPQVNAWPAYSLLIVLVFFLSLAFAVSTFLSFNWFCVVSGSLSMWWVAAQPEWPFLAENQQSWAAMGLSFITFLLAWLVRQKAEYWLFRYKWILFLGYFLALMGIIQGAGTSLHPLVTLIQTGVVFPLIMSFVFIVWVAIDVLCWVFFQLSKSQPSRQAFGQFALFSLIYVGNLALYYLKGTGDIQWDGVVVGPLPVLFISVFAGFFFLEEKSSIFKDFLPFRPLAPVLFLAFAAITFSTIGSQAAQANDAMLEVFEDAIVMVHGCIGLLLVIYFLINYFDLLTKNLAVHRVMFQPRYMPVSGIFVAGLVGVFFLVSGASRFQLFQAYAGYYNGLADASLINGDTLLGREMYEAGKFQADQNHKSNFALGMLDLRKGDIEAARNRFQDATLKNPTPQASLALVQTYEVTDKYFDQLFSLQQGLKQFPNEPALMNNLALMFAKTKLSDSARYYFEQLAYQQKDAVGTGNFAFWLIKKQAHQEAFDLMAGQTDKKADAWVANRYLLELLLNAKEKSKVEITSNASFPALYNGVLLQAKAGDTTNLKRLRAILVDSIDAGFNEEARLALAYGLYFGGNKAEAFDQLNWLAQQGYKMPAYYHGLAGKLAMIENDAETASWYFSRAVQAGDVRALIYEILAQTEAGGEEVNVALLQTINALEPSPAEKDLMAMLIDVNSNSFEALSSDDARELWLLKHLKQLPFSTLQANLEQISNPDVQKETLVYMLRQMTNRGDVAQANNLISAAKKSFGELEIFQLASFRNKASVLTMMNENEKLDYDLNIQGFSAWSKGLKLWAKPENRKEAISVLKSANVQLPLEWPLVNNIVDGLHAMDESEQALEYVAARVREFPEQVHFLKKYILQCARTGLPELSTKYLVKLSLKLSAEEFAAFEQEYQEILRSKFSSF